MNNSQLYKKKIAQAYDNAIKMAGYNYEKITNLLMPLLKGRGSILELGIGSGNLAIPLLESGFSVSGIDCSGEMLEILRYKLKEKQLNIPVQNTNVLSFDFNQKFDAIISYGGPFYYIRTNKGFFIEGYLLKEEDYCAAFKNIAKHLKVGGILIINIEPFPKSRSFNLENGLTYEIHVTTNSLNMEKVHRLMRGNGIIEKQKFYKRLVPHERIEQSLSEEGFDNFYFDESSCFFSAILKRLKE